MKLVALCKNFALRIKSKINKDMKPAASLKVKELLVFFSTKNLFSATHPGRTWIGKGSNEGFVHYQYTTLYIKYFYFVSSYGRDIWFKEPVPVEAYTH